MVKLFLFFVSIAKNTENNTYTIQRTFVEYLTYVLQAVFHFIAQHIWESSTYFEFSLEMKNVLQLSLKVVSN